LLSSIPLRSLWSRVKRKAKNCRFFRGFNDDDHNEVIEYVIRDIAVVVRCFEFGSANCNNRKVRDCGGWNNIERFDYFVMRNEKVSVETYIL